MALHGAHDLEIDGYVHVYSTNARPPKATSSNPNKAGRPSGGTTIYRAEDGPPAVVITPKNAPPDCQVLRIGTSEMKDVALIWYYRVYDTKVQPLAQLRRSTQNP